ncbi:hypothetical protein HMPREF9080_02094 [Cardiobacterium valvarum F0432]|uniref:Uncharacterized protein n=1 Tax=Cardiobacterium valvarum F0432 TaxID=797473 RepID=G9ZH37_9GAMM|nr:hypothetical protein HMPREF9080_02094 [Cardiobacterium valvarum F0432]
MASGKFLIRKEASPSPLNEAMLTLLSRDPVFILLGGLSNDAARRLKSRDRKSPSRGRAFEVGKGVSAHCS